MHTTTTTTIPRLAAAVLLVTGLLNLAAIAPAAAAPNIAMFEGHSATNSEQVRFAKATCPAGTVAYGGGGDIVGGGHEVILQQVNHFGHTTEYGAFASEDADGYSGDWTLYAWVLCGPPIAGLVTVSAAASPSSASFQSVTAFCPAGTRLISMGAQAVGYGGLDLTEWAHLILDGMAPSSDLTSVTVQGFEDQSGTAGAWQVTATANCAPPRPNQRLVTAATTYTAGDKTTSADCPAGTRPYAVGGGLDGAGGHAHLDRLVPHSQSNVIGGDIDARRDADGPTRTWQAEVQVICGG